MCKSSDMVFDVVVIGSANLDLVAHLEHLPKPGQTLLASSYAEHPGGKGLNQAVACARMGAKTAFVGCVGDDDAGRFLRSVLESERIDTTMLRTVSGPTGRAFINIDSRGENEIVVVLGANAQVGLLDGRSESVVDEHLEIPSCSVILAQLEIPQKTITSVFAKAKQNGATTVLNPAPAAILVPEIIKLSDIIVPNETEAQSLGGVDALIASGIASIVVTQGERGANYISYSGSSTSVVHFDPYVVTPIDTVGAGDAFIGAMCAEIARGVSIGEACSVAVVAGALATTVNGAVRSMPTRTAVVKALGV